MKKEKVKMRKNQKRLKRKFKNKEVELDFSERKTHYVWEENDGTVHTNHGVRHKCLLAVVKHEPKTNEVEIQEL